MWNIIQYILLSIIIICIGHFSYFYLYKENNESKNEPNFYNLDKTNKEREKVLTHMREEEVEDEQLQQYVQSKLNILNT